MKKLPGNETAQPGNEQINKAGFFVVFTLGPKSGCTCFQPFPSNGKTELDPAAAMATTGQKYLRYDDGMKQTLFNHSMSASS